MGSTAIPLHTIRVTNPGILAADVAQARIDIRGIAIVSHVSVAGLQPYRNGIRLRQNGAGGLEGQGSRRRQ